MAATSERYGDLIIWVERVIDSCQNMEQIKTADRLLRLLDERLTKELDSELYFQVKISLLSKLRIREDSLYAERMVIAARKIHERDSDEGNLS